MPTFEAIGVRKQTHREYDRGEWWKISPKKRREGRNCSHEYLHHLVAVDLWRWAEDAFSIFLNKCNKKRPTSVISPGVLMTYQSVFINFLSGVGQR